MAAYRLSEPAHRDLDDIWHYIAKDSPKAADSLLDSLYEKFLILSSAPRMGRVRNDLAPDLRSFPVDDYLIFYRTIRGGVEVARIIHAARNVEFLWRKARD